MSALTFLQNIREQYWPKLRPYLKWRKIGLTLLVIFVFFVVVGSCFFIYIYSQTPDPDIIASRRISESTKIYDRTGKILLYDVHGEEKRTVVSQQDIPEGVKLATVASEDDEFYQHKGIDWKGILRAVYKDAVSGSASQGGSTITQQLIKNALLGQEKTVTRKVKEIILAVKIEKKFTKDQLLWWYLNQIPYGSNTYGIEEAAQTFFGIPAKELSLAQGALLTALIKRPSYLSPYGKHVDELLAKKDWVLMRMFELKMITKEQYQKAKAEKLVFSTQFNSIRAPHFTLMVRDYLVEKYGEDAVMNEGMKVTTTLDMNLQDIAEGVVKKYGDINQTKYKASNAAFVAADPKTGEILAMVGSRDYFNTENGGNFNVATSPHRQPGSSFKPFVYATAFEKGFTDKTVLFDLPTEFNPSCPASADGKNKKCYHPQDYTGKFVGPIVARQALAQSMNIPAVEMLYMAGISDSIKTAQRFGITTLDNANDVGLALVLGGAGVKLVDMVSAYGVFANDGVHLPQQYILQITNADGTVVEQNQGTGQRVLSQQSSRTVCSILSDNEARTPLFGASSALYIAGRQVAAKTGTTNDGRDAWIIGFTPSLVAGAWAGNNDNTPMINRGGGSVAAAPMWHDFMLQALKNTPNEFFPAPAVVPTDKPILNGQFIGPDGVHTTLYYVDPQNPQGPAPKNPASDPQFNNWEYSVRNWALAAGLPLVGQPDIPPAPLTSETPVPVFSPSPQ